MFIFIIIYYDICISTVYTKFKKYLSYSIHKEILEPSVFI